MSDEHPTRIRIDGEQPPIPVGTASVVPDPPQEDDGSPGSCALFGTAYHSIYFREPGGVLFKAASDRYDFSTRK
jgi:hypothetical protein